MSKLSKKYKVGIMDIRQKCCELRRLNRKLLEAYRNEVKPHSPNDRKKWSSKVDKYEKKCEAICKEIAPTRTWDVRPLDFKPYGYLIEYDNKPYNRRLPFYYLRLVNHL